MRHSTEDPVAPSAGTFQPKEDDGVEFLGFIKDAGLTHLAWRVQVPSMTLLLGFAACMAKMYAGS